jgi:hypothetical protein
MEPYREEPKNRRDCGSLEMSVRTGLLCKPSHISNSGNLNMDNSIIKLPQDKPK